LRDGITGQAERGQETCGSSAVNRALREKAAALEREAIQCGRWSVLLIHTWLSMFGPMVDLAGTEYA
jgi:hypothetical protein